MSDADMVPIRGGAAGRLAALHRLCMPAADGWTGDGLKRLIEADAATGYQADTTDGSPVGFVLAFAAADEAEVLALCVAPEHRRTGLGRRLLHQLELELASRQIVRIYLEARASNLAARELYRHVGFGEVGWRKRYYPPIDGQSEDAVLMAKSIGGRQKS